MKCRLKATGVAQGRCDHEESTELPASGAGTLRWRVLLPSGKLCHFAAFLHKDTRAAVSGRSAPTPGAWPTFSYFEPPKLDDVRLLGRLGHGTADSTGQLRIGRDVIYAPRSAQGCLKPPWGKQTYLDDGHPRKYVDDQ